MISKIYIIAIIVDAMLKKQQIYRDLAQIDGGTVAASHTQLNVVLLNLMGTKII